MYKKNINTHRDNRATSQNASLNTHAGSLGGSSASQSVQPERRNRHFDKSSGGGSLASVVAMGREHSNGPAT